MNYNSNEIFYFFFFSVSGIMLSCGLRDLRSEKRLRIPKEAQEKVLKKYLEDVQVVNDENEIPCSWIQKLVHCRSDFGALEMDAVSFFIIFLF